MIEWWLLIFVLMNRVIDVDDELMYTKLEEELWPRVFDFRVEVISQKTWFYKIWTPAAWLSGSVSFMWITNLVAS